MLQAAPALCIVHPIPSRAAAPREPSRLLAGRLSRHPEAAATEGRRERRAEATLERWRPPEEIDDGPANAENVEPLDAHDGLYVGVVTMRADGRVVTIKLKVTNGVGAGTQIQRECGVAPIALKVSSTGNVSGLALMFSSTCLKTEMAIRGRAIGGTLQLRLGNQYLELAKAND